MLSTLAAGLAAVIAMAGIAMFREATAGVGFPFWTDLRLHPQSFCLSPWQRCWPASSRVVAGDHRGAERHH